MTCARCERLERTLDSIRAIITDQVEEVHNSIGGTVGYTLTLGEELTRELWNLSDYRAALAAEPQGLCRQMNAEQSPCEVCGGKRWVNDIHPGVAPVPCPRCGGGR